MLKPTIAILIDTLPIVVNAHVVSELVRHDQSSAAQALSLRYCARCLDISYIEAVWSH